MAERVVKPDLLSWEDWVVLPKAERFDYFKSLPRSQAENFFDDLPAAQQMKLLLTLPYVERRFWIRSLEPDDAVDLIQEAPDDEKSGLLELLDATTRQEVIALMAYAEDEAGGLMSPRFARVRPDMTIDEAIRYLRKQALMVETLHYTYVLDSRQKLLGVVSFRELFSAESHHLVENIMLTTPVTVFEDMEQDQVGQVLSQHDLVAVPVVDADGIMKGIVTFDDIVDVVTESATEDIQKLGGTEALDMPYMTTPFLEMVRKRLGWLSFLFLGEMLTASAMAVFEHDIAKAVVLALFIPLIISSGGNSGSQAATLVIRAMALGEVRLAEWWRVLRRELGAGVLMGTVLGSIGFVRVVSWHLLWGYYGAAYIKVAATVFFSLIGVVLWGTISGSMLPFVLRRLGFDPASASTPFVATLVDVTGLVIYFTIASVVLL